MRLINDLWLQKLLESTPARMRQDGICFLVVVVAPVAETLVNANSGPNYVLDVLLEMFTARQSQFVLLCRPAFSTCPSRLLSVV